jgi:hypothetical protein
MCHECCKASALNYFSKFQLGVGVSMGSEAVVHCIKKKIELLSEDSDRAVLQIDFTNAFNVVNRCKMIDEVRINFPSGISPSY